MKLTRLLTLASLFAAPAAFAHVGHMEHGSHHSFMEGFIHPLTGLDHLVMLLGLGMLINRVRVNDTNAKGKISLAVAALLTLTLGLAAGRIIGAISGVELMIAASVFVVALGIWNAFTSRESMTQFLVTASIGLVFFHGYAHGVEATGGLMGFGAGMLVAASLIMFVGERASHLLASKWLGAGIAASGIALMMAS
ncbi:HupE/UreJ family protein [Vibrio aphrogenes]|uniref:HupE/UreJ family protein n=1 Tax=Vibrio aphrogenes TaxID=1891186 RepID=UPI000B34AAFE|nr:HupE/UreJ family protein [Vibrio aphrogenes]